jgi:hypothetical protein
VSYSVAVLVIAALVCVAALLAWRWYLAHLKWEMTQKAAVRDAALEELGPRMTALEQKLKDAAYANVFKQR